MVMKSTQRPSAIVKALSSQADKSSPLDNSASVRKSASYSSTFRRGTAHKLSKLTIAKVHAIRRAYDRGEATQRIAERFCISPPQACNIGKRRAWAWLPEKDVGAA
jgi:hypothetical protein